jgi:hypothetical protein
MAVGYVMYHLPDGPAAGPVGSIELLIGKSGDYGSYSCRGFRNLFDELRAFFRRDRIGKFELTNGVTKVNSVHGRKIRGAHSGIQGILAMLCCFRT